MPTTTAPMKTLIWTLGYPLVCAIFMVARATAFRRFTEDEYVWYNTYNTGIWVFGIACCFFSARRTEQ